MSWRTGMDSLYNAPGFALNTSKLFALHATNYTIRSSRNTHNTSLVTLRFAPHTFQRILPASRFTFQVPYLISTCRKPYYFPNKKSNTAKQKFSLKEKKNTWNTFGATCTQVNHEFHQKPVTSGPLLPSSSKLPCVGVCPYGPFPGTAVYYTIGSRLREKLSDDLIVNSPFWLLFISL